MINGQPTAWHPLAKAIKQNQTHLLYEPPKRRYRPMRAASTTKKDVPDDRNPQTCPTEPPNIPPIRNRMTLHAQRPEGTTKEDTSNDKDFLRMPTLLGSNSSNTYITPAYQKDQCVTIHPIFRSYHLPQQTRRHPVPNPSSLSLSRHLQNRPQYR